LATTEVLVADIALVSSASEPAAEPLSPSSRTSPTGPTSEGLNMLFISIGGGMGVVALVFSLYAYRTWGANKPPNTQLKVTAAPQRPPSMGRHKIAST
jgi:hypothetical protein